MSDVAAIYHVSYAVPVMTIGLLAILVSPHPTSFTLSFKKIRKWASFWFSHFVNPKINYREQWLKFSQLNEVAPAQVPIQVIQSLAALVQSAKGILFQWDEKRGYILKECWNVAFPSQETLLQACPFTDRLHQSRTPIEFSELLNSNEHAFTMLPPAMKQFTWAWLLIPLWQQNSLQGFAVLARPRHFMENIDKALLDVMALASRQATTCLLNAQMRQALTVAQRFEECHRAAAFVSHDLKNVLAPLIAIQSNKAKHENNPAFIKSVYQTLEHTTHKIDRLLIALRAGQYPLPFQDFDIKAALHKVIQLTQHRTPVPFLCWQATLSTVVIQGNEEQFINILCHLVENAQQATPLEGKVLIEISIEKELLIIAIKDNGCGMAAEFVQVSLYQPFVTTKGANGTGIGVYEAREYVQAAGGKLMVESCSGKGSTFRLEFPHFIHKAISQ